MLSKYPAILLAALLTIVQAGYIPEVMLATTSEFLNWQLAKNGDAIDKFL